jgi:uncharacterized protein RhaS with RHS repeats
MRHRWYDCELQRFISRDPIGMRGGSNQYVYVENRPHRGVDPSGLICKLTPGSYLWDQAVQDYTWTQGGDANAFLGLLTTVTGVSGWSAPQGILTAPSGWQPQNPLEGMLQDMITNTNVTVELGINSGIIGGPYAGQGNIGDAKGPNPHMIYPATFSPESIAASGPFYHEIAEAYAEEITGQLYDPNNLAPWAFGPHMAGINAENLYYHLLNLPYRRIPNPFGPPAFAPAGTCGVP